MFFLGVDGGGTKTAFLLIDDRGRAVSRTTLGCLDWFRIGAEGFRSTLDRGITHVCGEAGIERSGIAFTVLGIPCLGDELIDEEPTVVDLIRELLPNGRFKAVNDAEVGWAGSLACRPGVHLVAGTGSIGYGVDAAGRAARAGGWGHALGDEGSACWLGVRLLQHFTREADGREERSLLYETVRRHFGLDNDFRLLQRLHEWAWSRERIAGLARLLHEAAEAGEPKAVQAFDSAAFELSLIVRTIARELGISGETEIPVSYSGGVFRAGAFMTEPLRNYLGDGRFRLQQPELEPVAGAALYAIRLLRPDTDLSPLIREMRLQQE